MGAIRFWGGQPVSNWRGSGGIAWSGSTANGLATYGDASTIVAESTATYDGTTLQLTTAGGGLKMDGLDSADANTLSDYEVGTCSIGMEPATSGSITMTADNAGYTKIGRMVTVGGRVFVQSVSSPDGNVKITGLPFIIKNAYEYEPCGLGYVFGLGASNAPVALTATKNGTEAWLYLLTAATLLQGATVTANAELQFTITYATTA